MTAHKVYLTAVDAVCSCSSRRKQQVLSRRRNAKRAWEYHMGESGAVLLLLPRPFTEFSLNGQWCFGVMFKSPELGWSRFLLRR